MTAILTVSAAYAALYIFLRHIIAKEDINKEKNALYIIGAVTVSAAVSLICAAKYPGHKTDINCFSAWADMVFKGGFGNFYTSDAFHDYPPGYMYILYIIGMLKSAFSLGNAYTLCKIPAIICSLVTGCFIYKIALKKFSPRASVLIASIYLFNPAVITNGALWGQVDSVYTLAAVIMIYLLSEKKMIAAYYTFAVCIFIKPQSLILTPLLVLGIIENLFMHDFRLSKVLVNFAAGLCAILMLIVLSLPFGLSNAVSQYVTTVSEQYPYFTVNAFNVWGALGKNWSGLTSFVSAAGAVLIVLITLYSAYVFLKSKSRSKYYFTGALLVFLTYMLSVKMHDRYAFPAMALMLLAFAESKNKNDYILYVLLTISQFFNTAWVLFIYEQDINFYYKSPVVIAASIVNIALMLYMLCTAHRIYVAGKTEPEAVSSKNKADSEYHYRPVHIRKSEKLPKFTRFDIIAMAAVTVIYGAIALYDLGDMSAPETETMINGSAVTVDLGKDSNVTKLKYFLGSYNLDASNILHITYQNSDGRTVKTDDVKEGAVFCWSERGANVTARYITLSAEKKPLSIKELAVMDNDKYLQPVNTGDTGVGNLFDEQSLVPERMSFRNSTYFDEIYHARTAYEFIHHLTIYEWTHPPLGKLIIALGIMIFGMCPFGWRIAGTFFGILMVPVIYAFAKKLFKKSWLALVTCLLFTFDFMHFAQTRIATIDVYVTFFIMLMYYYMYKYRCMSFYDTPLKKTLIPLAFSGIFMGLGIASKWTGMYAGAGLAVIFFVTLARRYTEYRYALTSPGGETDGIKHADIIKNFKPYTIKTIIWCCIFFVLVPAVIYFCAYIPYMLTPSGDGIKTVFENAKSMYTYHSSTVLGSTHPYSSRWYQWPVMYRPIWFYSGTVVQGAVKEGISSFGNPAVWWAGIAAFIYMVYLAAAKRDRKALFLIIAYLAQFMPWIPISRLTFIYHYFPSVPFVVLMIGYSICSLCEGKDDKNIMYASFVYAAAAIALFAMFYPVLSGHPCTVEYAKYLKWFGTWVLL